MRMCPPTRWQYAMPRKVNTAIACSVMSMKPGMGWFRKVRAKICTTASSINAMMLAAATRLKTSSIRASAPERIRKVAASPVGFSGWVMLDACLTVRALWTRREREAAGPAPGRIGLGASNPWLRSLRRHPPAKSGGSIALSGHGAAAMDCPDEAGQ